MSNMPEDKICTKCGILKPTSEFYKSKRDGLRCYCKFCNITESSKWTYEKYREDPERFKSLSKKWRKEHPGKFKEYQKKWAHANLKQRNEAAKTSTKYPKGKP